MRLSASTDHPRWVWEKAIKPTLFDFNGEALVCSNSNGKDPDNFFYNICTDPKYGFKEHHATTLDNPLQWARGRWKSRSVICRRVAAGGGKYGLKAVGLARMSP